MKPFVDTDVKQPQFNGNFSATLERKYPISKMKENIKA